MPEKNPLLPTVENKKTKKPTQCSPDTSLTLVLPILCIARRTKVRELMMTSNSGP